MWLPSIYFIIIHSWKQNLTWNQSIKTHALIFLGILPTDNHASHHQNLFPVKKLKVLSSISIYQPSSWIFFQPEFYQVCHTKAQYDEYGPSICRHNPVFGTMTWAPFYSTSTLHFWFLTWLVLPDAISCNQESKKIQWHGSWSDNDDSGSATCVSLWGLEQILETWDVRVIFDIAKWPFVTVVVSFDHLVTLFGRHDLTPFCL